MESPTNPLGGPRATNYRIGTAGNIPVKLPKTWRSHCRSRNLSWRAWRTFRKTLLATTSRPHCNLGWTEDRRKMKKTNDWRFAACEKNTISSSRRENHQTSIWFIYPKKNQFDPFCSSNIYTQTQILYIPCLTHSGISTHQTWDLYPNMGNKVYSPIQIYLDV